MTPEDRKKLAEWFGWRLLPASGAMNQDYYEDRHEQFLYWAEEECSLPFNQRIDNCIEDFVTGN